MSASTTLPRRGRRSVAIDRDQARSRHGKRRIDARLSELFGAIGGLGTKAVLRDLVAVVRTRSSLLDPENLPRRGVPGVEALRNLAACADAFLRLPGDWPGCSGSPREVVHHLAEFLLCRYPVPRVLSADWFSPWGGVRRQSWRWFLEHGRGRRLRDLDLPIPLTRGMERHFLSTPHDLSLHQGLRRAELMGLGATAAFARQVCEQTRMGYDLSEPEFWRTASLFLVRVQDEVRTRDIGPIVDFLHGIRFATTEVVHPDGVEVMGPPQPDFSLRGRTLASVLRLVDGWHHALGRTPVGGQRWAPSGYEAMTFRRPVRNGTDEVLWELVELCSSEDLWREGVALQHCVASYAVSCLSGRSRIWSLRSRKGRCHRPLLTVEVDPSRDAVVQARGRGNRSPNGGLWECLVAWARREGLRIEIESADG